MLFAATRASGTISPPDAASDRVAVMVAEAVPPSAKAVRFALRLISGPRRTRTDTLSMFVPLV